MLVNPPVKRDIREIMFYVAFYMKGSMFNWGVNGPFPPASPYNTYYNNIEAAPLPFGLTGLLRWSCCSITQAMLP